MKNLMSMILAVVLIFALASCTDCTACTSCFSCVSCTGCDSCTTDNPETVDQSLLYTEITINQLHQAIKRQPLKYNNTKITLEGYALAETLNSFYLCFPIPTTRVDLTKNGKMEQYEKGIALEAAKASDNAILVEYDLDTETVRVLEGDYVVVSATLIVEIIDGKEIKIDLVDVVCEIKPTPVL